MTPTPAIPSRLGMSRNVSDFLRHRCSGLSVPVEDQPPEDLSHRNAPTGTNPKAVKGPTNGFDTKPPGLLVTVTPPELTHHPTNQFGWRHPRTVSTIDLNYLSKASYTILRNPLPTPNSLPELEATHNHPWDASMPIGLRLLKMRTTNDRTPTDTPRHQGAPAPVARPPYRKPAGSARRVAPSHPADRSPS